MQDEVIAVSEKVTVKLEDLAKWAQSDFSKWKCGFRAEPVKPMDVGKNGQKEALMRYRQSTLNSGLNFKDILKEKADLGEYPLLSAGAGGLVGEQLLEADEPDPAEPSPVPKVRLCLGQRCGDELPEQDGWWCWW